MTKQEFLEEKDFAFKHGVYRYKNNGGYIAEVCELKGEIYHCSVRRIGKNVFHFFTYILNQSVDGAVNFSDLKINNK